MHGRSALGLTADAYKRELAAFLAAFGERVRTARKERVPALSQERLAAEVGLHRTEIGRIEAGSVEPRLTTLVILAQGLGVSVDELLLGLPEPVERKPSPHTEIEGSANRRALS